MTTLSMNRRASAWRRFVGGLSTAALLLQMGCYTFQPLRLSMPATGTRVAVAINDRGRFLLANRLGSSVDKIDGLLVSADSMNVTFDVYRTTDMRGTSASWTGERVQVPRDAITGYQERKFSKARTALLVGSIVGVIAVVALTTNFDLFSGFKPDEPGGGTTGDSR
jgi:hypothetical protein